MVGWESSFASRVLTLPDSWIFEPTGVRRSYKIVSRRVVSDLVGFSTMPFSQNNQTWNKAKHG